MRKTSQHTVAQPRPARGTLPNRNSSGQRRVRRRDIVGGLRCIAGALALFVGLSGCGTDTQPDRHFAPLTREQAHQASSLQAQVGDLPIVAVEVEATAGRRVVVVALLAGDEPTRAQGLMGVDELADGTGMLFVFDQPTTAGFWMYGTRIALDVAFIADGQVVATATMQPCHAEPCPVTRAPQPYDAALEAPAGWFAEVGVGVGATVAW